MQTQHLVFIKTLTTRLAPARLSKPLTLLFALILIPGFARAQAPTINCPGNLTVSTDPGGCVATLPDFGVTAFSANGDVLTVVYPGLGPGSQLSPSPFLPLITATATDDNGQTASCSFTVTVADLQPPNIFCNDITVNLAGAGTYAVTATDEAAITSGTNDACSGLASVGVFNGQTTYGCLDRGAQVPVTFRATDNNGQSATCVATITVTDFNGICSDLPNAVCNSVTRDADGNCEAAVAGAELGMNSNDPNGLPLTFSAAPAGPYPIGTTPVTLSVSNGTDTETCTTSVTVNGADIDVNDAAVGTVFADQAVSTSGESKTYTVSNFGNQNLVFIAAFSNNPDFTLFNRPFSVAPGATHDFIVTFTPGAAAGPRSANIILIAPSTCDPDEVQYSFTVTGTAVGGGNVWTGASPEDNNWTTPGNWSANAVPGPGDEAIFDGSATATAFVDQAVTVDKLTINTTGDINLRANVTVTTLMTLTNAGQLSNAGGNFGYFLSGDLDITDTDYRAGETNYANISDLRFVATTDQTIFGAGSIHELVYDKPSGALTFDDAGLASGFGRIRVLRGTWTLAPSLTITAVDGFLLDGGRLDGDGTIDGALSVGAGGTVSPGGND